MKKLASVGLSSVVVLGLVACGGNEPPPKEPEPVAMPTPNRAPKPGLQMQQELGSLDPKKAEAAFERVKPKIVDCQMKALKRLDFIAGDAKFYLRLDTSGKVKWIFLEESQIGDRETEKCVLEVLTNAAWPAPEGGEGELHKGFGYELQDAREPVAWGQDKARVGEIADQVKHCRGGGKDMTFHVTAYVEPEGKHGKVSAVGIAASTKEAAEKSDCVAEAVKGMKFPSPGGYAAKISFSL